MSSNNSDIVVGFPLYEGCTLLDFAGATQMFASAGFTPVWLAAKKNLVKTTEGVSVMPHETFDTARKIDILFIPGGGGDGVSKAMLDKSFVEHIDHFAEHACWAGSVCTGAFIFAATGRFSGLKATTYWSQLENLALFPDVQVSLDCYPRGLLDCESQIFSGGGVSSSIDLSLSLINEIKGREICETVELANQYAPQPQFRSGTPAEAPPLITDKLRHAQETFICQIREASLEAIARL